MNVITDGEVRRAKEKAVGGKKDRCRKGKSCSATCISGWKACLVQMSSGVSSSLRGAKKLVERKARQVLPGLRGKYLEEKREQFTKARQKTIAGIKRAALKGDQKREEELRNRLNRLQSGPSRMSSKLKVPAVNVSTDQSQERRIKYGNFKKSLVQELERLAKEGKKGSYEKIEERLMRLQDKLGGRFGDKDIVAKGKIWNEHGKERVKVRESKLGKALGKLSSDLEDAFNKKDYAKFIEIYGKYRDLNSSKAAKKLGMNIDDFESAVRRFYLKRLEEDPLFAKFRDDLRAEVRKAASDGDRKKYLDLESKLMLLLPQGSVKKGAIWREVGFNMTLNKLIDAMEKATIAKDKDKYDKLESKFLKIRLNPKVSFLSMDERVRLINRKGVVWGKRDDLLLQKRMDDYIRLGKEFMDRRRERLNSAFSIQNRRIALEKEIKDRLYGDKKMTAEERMRLQRMLDRVVSKGDNASAKSIKLMEEIRAELLKTKLSEDDIKGILGRLNLSGDEALVGQVRGQVEEFARMFNGKGLLESAGNGMFLKEMEVNPRARAYANMQGFISTDGTGRTTFHEIAHLMEVSNTAIRSYAEKWRDGKALTIYQVETTKGIESLVRVLNGKVSSRDYELVNLSGRILPTFGLAGMPINKGLNYTLDEVAVVDKFMSPYMGKVYPSRMTEVMSMGVEKFSDPKGMKELYMAHPDLFETIVGLALR